MADLSTAAIKAAGIEMGNVSIFGSIAKTLGADLTENLFELSGDLISAIAPIFAIIFGIYLLFIGLSYWRGGGMDEMLVDFMKRMIAWALIIGFAFNASNYFELAQLIYSLPDSLAQAIGQKNFENSALDALVDNMDKLQVTIEEKRNGLDWYDIGTHITYIMVGLAVNTMNLVIMGLTFAYYMVSKIALSMILMIGPIFIGCLLFPATRQWGMNWIGQCLNYIFIIFLFVILGSIQQKYFETLILKAMATDYIDIQLLLALIPMFLIPTIVFALVALNIRGIAAALTGGATLSSGVSSLMTTALRIKSLGLLGSTNKAITNRNTITPIPKGAKNTIAKGG